MTDKSLEAADVLPSQGMAKRRKRVIVLGVVIACVLAAGAEFWTWHEQPSFCAAICHTPMDAYLETYEQPLGESGVDKWGNEVETTVGMMAVVHASEKTTCLGCHEPQITEQISEGLNWVSGNYRVITNKLGQEVLEERTLADLTEAKGVASEQFCLNDSCHTGDDGDAMTLEELKDKTADRAYNPHDGHTGEQECGSCHKAHAQSVNTCTECHAEAEIPEGWLSVGQAEKLQKAAASE